MSLVSLKEKQISNFYDSVGYKEFNSPSFLVPCEEGKLGVGVGKIPKDCREKLQCRFPELSASQISEAA